MKRVFSLIAVLFALHTQAQLKYPETKKVDTITDYHGQLVADPYRWLEDDWSAETKDWVMAQNKVTFDYLDKISYRADWLKRLEEINNYPKYSSPSRSNAYFYFIKTMVCKIKVFYTDKKD